MEQAEKNKRNHPFTYEELEGQAISMPAMHYQGLCQALVTVEGLLNAKDGVVDYSNDQELGEVHHHLIGAAMCTNEKHGNRKLVQDIKDRIIPSKTGQDNFDKVISNEQFNAFTDCLSRFQSLLLLIGDDESRQLYADDITRMLRPIYDEIDLIWASAYDHGKALHEQAMESNKKADGVF